MASARYNEQVLTGQSLRVAWMMKVDLDEADVRRGFFHHRCVEEGWQTAAGAGDGYVGRRVRMQRPGGDFIYATVVGYIGQGEEEEDAEMWHVIHVREPCSWHHLAFLCANDDNLSRSLLRLDPRSL